MDIKTVFASPPPDVTLANVLARIQSDKSLYRYTRRDVRVSLNRLSRFLGEDLADLPADFSVLRPVVADLHHAQLDVPAYQIRRVKHNLTFALKHTGIWVLRMSRTPLSSQWRKLFDRLTICDLRFSLSRFIRFCDEFSVAPDDVCDEIADAYRFALEHKSFTPRWKKTHRQMCRAWNDAAESIAEWPQTRLTVPSYQETYSEFWNSLPASFHEDLRQYLLWLGGDYSIRDTWPPQLLKESSRTVIHYQIRTAIAYYARRGNSIATMRSLKDLVSVPVVQEIFRYRFQQRGSLREIWERKLAQRFLLIAIHWVRADRDQIDQLRRIYRRMGPTRFVISDRNVVRLRQFNSDHNRKLLFQLPGVLMAEAVEGNPGAYHSAVTAQTAALVELLLNVPGRISWLARLRCDQHIRWVNEQNCGALISIPQPYRREGYDMTFALSRQSASILETYIKRFRGELTNMPSNWLFPGKNGGHKTVERLGQQVRRRARASTGLTVSPDLFRHLAAKLMLEAEPDAYEVVRRLLGHTRLSSTRMMYANLITDSAIRQYDNVVRDLRARDQ